jgi:hypothetical protein
MVKRAGGDWCTKQDHLCPRANMNIRQYTNLNITFLHLRSSIQGFSILTVHFGDVARSEPSNLPIEPSWPSDGCLATAHAVRAVQSSRHLFSAQGIPALPLTWGTCFSRGPEVSDVGYIDRHVRMLKQTVPRGGSPSGFACPLGALSSFRISFASSHAQPYAPEAPPYVPLHHRPQGKSAPAQHHTTTCRSCAPVPTLTRAPQTLGSQPLPLLHIF